jgi:hypothetical protein
MAQLIILGEARQAPAIFESHMSDVSDAEIHAQAKTAAKQQLPRKEDVFRAILLLDLAIQQAHLLVKRISDASPRIRFEAKITKIEELLQLAGSWP